MRHSIKQKLLWTTLVVYLLLLLVCCVILYGHSTFQSSMSLDPSLEYQISIKDYRSGTNISVTETDDQRAILQSISTIRYKGITGSHPTDGQTSAYSLILSSADRQTVFIITEDTSAIVSTPFRLRIDASDLYACARDLFSKYAHAENAR